MIRRPALSGAIQPAVKKPRTNKTTKATKATKNSGPFTPFQLPLNDDPSVRYTKIELDQFHETRCRRYDDLLNCARNNQEPPSLLLPPLSKYAIPMTRICFTIRVKLELIDIYRFIQKTYTKVQRNKKIAPVLSLRTFENYIGVYIHRNTLNRWLAQEEKLRQMAPQLTMSAKYLVNRKNRMVEEVIIRWLENQRSLQLPVHGKAVQNAAQVTYKILIDSYESVDSEGGNVPSFSVGWFCSFKKRYQIKQCRLYGEAGSVDLEAIEPEMAEIRELCENYDVDDIYNCDETGMYLKELNAMSYTVVGDKSGAKADRGCRVSILFCVNASGTSLASADDDAWDSLRPLVIGKNMARGVEDESLKRMNIRKTSKGWMNRNLFLDWLISFDDQLKKPTLLLLDSCPAHNNIDMRDADNNVPWKFLHIRRLPVNSTSVSQPLDAGIISVFKRAMLNLVCDSVSLVRTANISRTITNGKAWSLIPYAWDQLKPSTLRNCFAKTNVLSATKSEQLRRRRRPAEEQREHIRYQHRDILLEERRAHFENLIAETIEGNNEQWHWKFRQDGIMDAQDIADQALSAEPAVEGVDETTESVATPLQARAVGSDTDDGVSSAVPEADFEASVGYLRSLVGGRDPLSADGLKAMRVAASSGSPEGQEVSKLIKALVRATAKVQSTVEPAFSDNPSHSAASDNHNHNAIVINSDGSGDSDSSDEPLIRRRTTTVSTVHGLAPIGLCVDFGRGLFDGLEGEVGVGFGFGEEADIRHDGRDEEDHTGDYSVYSGSGNAADKSCSENGSGSDNNSNNNSDDDSDDNM